MVDDLRPQLGCYGDAAIQTPNIDRLAERGLVFERAYCQMAICMASRASVLTGYRPDRGEMFRNRAVFEHVPDALTINQHFLNNGYETGCLGKVYHHRSDLETGWSEPPYWPTEGTWSESDWYGRGYLSAEGKRTAREHDRIHKTGRRGMGPAFEGPETPDGAYSDGLVAARAIRELNRPRGKPFFMAVGFIKPHLPFNAPKKYWDLYDEHDIEQAANSSAPEGAPPQALTDWGELRGYYGMPKEGPMPDDLARKLIHGYYACTSYTDALIGGLLDELDRLGLADDTVVVLWGDHGWKLGDHGMWCKHTNFELDTRVPLIIAAPGMKARGATTRAFVELVDLYPTLCDLCGIDKPAHLEGLSAAPLLDDPDRPWKDAAFSQFFRKPGEVLGYSVRTDRYRYTEWRTVDNPTVTARELYDYQSDPNGDVNVIEDSSNAELVASLAERLRAGHEAAQP